MSRVRFHREQAIEWAAQRPYVEVRDVDVLRVERGDRGVFLEPVARSWVESSGYRPLTGARVWFPEIGSFTCRLHDIRPVHEDPL